MKGERGVKVVYPVCCGVDVHKSFLVATIISSQGIEGSYQKRRFSTFNKSIQAFKQWLLDNQCFHVCMESTGKYWIPVFNLLENVIHVTIANPKWVSAVKGNKDDVKDSKWIGDLFRLGLVPGSFIPEKSIRILREYTRYRCKLIACKASEKNRFQNAFTVCNVALDSVVSSMFGKSARAITDYLVDGESFDPLHCVSLLKGALKKKAEQVVDAVDGFEMESEQKQRIRLIHSHMDFIDSLLNQLDEEIETMAAPISSYIELLCSIPGVDRLSAITLLSEIGTDMSSFGSSKRLCSWAGLTSGNNQSAGKKKSVRITRAGVYIKPALVQAAHAAARDTHSSYYRVKYEQISRRRGKKRAIIAIARMILTAAYAMLKTGEVFNPCDIKQLEQSEDVRKNQQDKNIRNAAKLLVAEGIVLPENLNLPSAG